MRAYGVSKPHPREVVSGDGWLVVGDETRLRLALVDGSGHGAPAAEVCHAALKSLSASAPQPLATALTQCHHALQGTRGAAISIADLEDGMLRFAGVGNVEGRLLTPSAEVRLVPQRGIAGAVMPKIRPHSLTVDSRDWCVVLYSDGISQRFRVSWEALLGDFESVLEDAADEWGRMTDDATIVAVVSR
jgi:serine phosphatase RsbU (regulator of sigma subunit)